MAQLLVRNIEDGVKDRLRRRAKRHGRSMEEEAREILRQAVLTERRQDTGAGSQIASLFRDLGVDFEIPEFKGIPIRPAKLPE